MQVQIKKTIVKTRQVVKLKHLIIIVLKLAIAFEMTDWCNVIWKYVLIYTSLLLAYLGDGHN